MAIRKEALACSEFAKLKAIYDDKKSVLKSLNESGKKVVCTAGCDVPEEVIIAGGMVPFPITGYYGGERPSAEKYLEYSFGCIWKGIWETILEDYKGMIQYLSFSSSQDMYLKIFYYLRTLKRLEPDRPLPELTYSDFELINHSMKAQLRNENELKIYIKQVEEWAGKKITEKELKDAIKLCNEYRAALYEFVELRKKENCRVLGSEALVVIGASMFMDKKDAIAAVKAVTEAAKSWPVVDLKRVYYAGSRQEITEVYDIAEANGCNIVAEDHDFGNRAFDTLVHEDYNAVSGLAARMFERMPSSEKGSIKNRVKYLGIKVEEAEPDVFLTYMNNNDEAFVWDLPSVKKEVLDPKNIPAVNIEKQNWPLIDKDGVAAKFADMSKM